MMKRYFLGFFTTLLTAAHMQAQCGSCGITISNANSASQLISSGQTLCISPTGTVSGDITILAGGKLCNQGIINSANVWAAGGTIINTGTINVNNITVSSAGSFTNEAMFEADSFLVIQANSKYLNSGTQTHLAFAIADHASAINNGRINTTLLYDSIGDFVNNMHLQITEGFANVWSSNCTNNGNITVVKDFANGYSSTFTNNANMVIQRDFYNGTNSTYTTKCMVRVLGSWANAATVLGPNSSCGGFDITGTSSNSGTVGSSGSFIDICDAGHPAGGFDANIGTVVNTTFCSCMNNCITVGVKETAASTISALKLYPNPASAYIKVSYFNNERENVRLDVKDMMGRIVLSKTQESFNGNNETDLNTSSLAEGTYLLSIFGTGQASATRMFTVVK